MSVTFVSPQDGFVLGQVTCRGTLCYGLAKTTDAGHSWTFVADLPVAPANNQPITKVRFADARDGWAFGPQLWATHDGGVSWHQLAQAGPVADVEAAAGVVYALAATCGAEPCAGGGRLSRAAVATDAWAAVPGIAVKPNGTIALHGQSVWVASGGESGVVFVTSADGARWHVLADPCPQGSGPSSLAGVAPVTASTVYLLCASDPGAGSETKLVLLSTDGGATAHATVTAPARGGLAGGIAAASASVVAVSAQSGASWIYRSADAGRTWNSAFEKGDGGLGIEDLGFTTSSQGVAIYGTPGNGNPSLLLMTRDAGATWSPVTF
jgi:photosystem II stability/assembly factor-like uncharacterized protein